MDNLLLLLLLFSVSITITVYVHMLLYQFYPAKKWDNKVGPHLSHALRTGIRENDHFFPPPHKSFNHRGSIESIEDKMIVRVFITFCLPTTTTEQYEGVIVRIGKVYCESVWPIASKELNV